MGKRVLAAFGVVAAMDGVLASVLSAASTSADAATSSTAERTGSNEEALAHHPRFVRGTRDSADVVGTGDHVADFGSGDSAPPAARASSTTPP